MPSYDSELFNVNPYYDDFNEDKKFLRMLFRPGYAVQSRELTQLQTILQNQIGKFGDHIFKDGSVIIGGQITTQTLNFVRLVPQSSQTTQTPVAKTITAEDVVGYNIIQRDGGSTGNVVAKAKVVDILPAHSGADNYAVAVISYMSGNEFTAGATVEFDTPNLLYTNISPSSSSVPHKGNCQTVAVAEGIFYVNGFFVRTNNQLQPAYTISVDDIREFSDPTGSMGFSVKSVIVTDRDDYTLRDPANGSYNYNAPGSHRYRIDLELAFTGVSDQPDFFELVRYSSGEVIRKFDQTQYPELVKLFAQRTYDQSGNYVVKPFSVTMKEKDSTNLLAEIGTGKAYVYGHEYESAFKDQVEVPKARDTVVYENVFAGNKFENYVIGKYKTPPNQTDAYFTDSTPLFEQYTETIGNQDPSSTAIQVYGTTGGPIGVTAYLAYGFSGAVFNALMHRLEFVSPNSSDSFRANSGNTGVEVKAFISNMVVRREPTSTSQNTLLNLYAINPLNGQSKRVLFDLTTLRDFGGTNSLLPKFNNFNGQRLIYPLNGSASTTLIKEVEDLSYVHTVCRSFFHQSGVPQVVPASVQPQNADSFRWCIRTGTVPTTPLALSEDDEYYLVYTATLGTGGQNPAIVPQNGFIRRIFGVGGAPSPRTESGTVISYPTAKIIDAGNGLQITTPLEPGQYTVIGRVKANNTDINQDTTGEIRTKSLVGITAETLTSTSETNRRTVFTGSSGGDPYSMYFRLNKADVYKIDSIVGSTGTDISYKFEFDSGQRDSMYQLARLYVKPKYVQDFTGSYNFTVSYKYFEHSGYGPFVAESYKNSGISYENIPVFVDPNSGKSINLANAVDYRPVETIIGYRQRGGTQFSLNPTFNDNVPIFEYRGGFVPLNNSVFSKNESYLPRIDKIVVSKNIAADGETTTLRRVPGIPSDVPQIPEDLNESMTLSILSIPAYTHNPEDVKIQSVANNRFSMKDISNMSKRVDDIEHHVILSDIESSILYRNITTSTGQDAIKRAILVDTFNGHSIGDVLNPDYRCSVDVEHGEMKPAFDSHAYSMEYVGGDSGLTLTIDNILCETYTRYSTPVVEQSKSSSKTAVNPFGFPNWVGNMFLRPHGDFWFDRDFRPVVKRNDDGMNDAWLTGNVDGLNGHGTQWNDWESLWTGLSTELTDAEGRKNAKFFAQSREKSNVDAIDKKFYNKGISRETDLGDSIDRLYASDFRKKDYYYNVSTDTVINGSVVPYMRDQVIIFNAANMKPGTQVHVFVDNVNMNDLCYRVSIESSGASGGTVYLLGSCGASGAGPFMTDQFNGSLTNVVVNIPRGLFEVGEKVIRVIDDPNNNLENATTVAEGVFYCNGIKNQNLLDVQSVRPLEVRKQTPNSNKVVSTPLFRRKNINTIKYNNWVDPMAQTFEVRDDLYPNGFFAESVDLYIATADDELPITLQICPVVNGVPNTSIALPFSTVVKTPSQLSVNSTTPIATTFKFSTPVFLSPGEYAITLHTNSTLYSVYTATIGEKDLTTDERISATLSKGSLFKSQNNSESIGENNTDLMFKLYRCSFPNQTQSRTISIRTLAEEDADAITNISTIQPNLFVFTPDEVTISGSLEAGSPAKIYSFTNSRNIHLNNVISQLDDSTPVELDLVVKNNSNGINTFMIDMDKTNVVAASYLITTGPTIEVEANPNAFRPKRSRVKRGGFGIFGLVFGAILGFATFGVGAAIAGAAIAGTGVATAIGTVGGGAIGYGLTSRGRRKWTYGKRLLIPEYISNPLEDDPVANRPGDETARYITRYVTIPNGVTAKELKVYFDGNIPGGTFVEAHAKTYDTTQLSENPDVQVYRKMTLQPANLFQSESISNVSNNDYDFKESSYSLVAPNNFNTFVVKLCMYSNNKAKVPTIKNLKVVAIS